MAFVNEKLTTEQSDEFLAKGVKNPHGGYTNSCKGVLNMKKFTMGKFYAICVSEIICFICIVLASVIGKRYELLIISGGMIPMMILTCRGYYKKVKNVADENQASDSY